MFSWCAALVPGDPQSPVHWQDSKGLQLRRSGVHHLCTVQFRLMVGRCLLILADLLLLHRKWHTAVAGYCAASCGAGTVWTRQLQGAAGWYGAVVRQWILVKDDLSARSFTVDHCHFSITVFRLPLPVCGLEVSSCRRGNPCRTLHSEDVPQRITVSAAKTKQWHDVRNIYSYRHSIMIQLGFFLLLRKLKSTAGSIKQIKIALGKRCVTSSVCVCNFLIGFS